MRTKIETQPWAKAAYEKITADPDRHEKNFSNLFRYAITSDKEAGEKEKAQLMKMVTSPIPRGGAQYINIVRYDMLYDLLSPAEHRLISECFDMYIENAIFNNAVFNPEIFNDDANYSCYDAREYNPHIGRFTSRDPVRGKLEEPLTLHKYLYCSNDPLSNTDPDGRSALQIASGLRAATLVYAAGLGIATYGADSGNFDLLNLGSLIQQASPLAFALGYSFTPEVISVARWGGAFAPGQYGTVAGSGFFSYLSTMKWVPWNFAAPSSVTTASYLAESLYMPTGALSYIDIILGYVIVPF